MSYLDALRHELARAGVGGRRLDRIVDEFADHLACDPEADLGSPRVVAERFADELGLAQTRRAALLVFGALALTAVLLAAAGADTSYPARVQNGWAVGLTGLGLVAGAQVAFVAGVLALARGRRRSLTCAERRLVQRRAAVALGAGILTCSMLVAHGVVFRQMPAAWTALTIAAGVVPLPLLAYAGARLRSAAQLTPAGGVAPGLSADLPGALGRHSRALLALLGSLAVAAVVAQGSLFERSASEGPARGVIELAGIAVGTAALGRVLGLFS
ncbi:MAG TPA: hypothetical protein VFB25_09590 [Gaiellaceae bacterium]|nr:hypothetical protein [Gaiellaceae bacterium]